MTLTPLTGGNSLESFKQKSCQKSSGELFTTLFFPFDNADIECILGETEKNHENENYRKCGGDFGTFYNRAERSPTENHSGNN